MGKAVGRHNNKFMEDNVFILPGDEAGLVSLYLDREKYEVLLDRQKLCGMALANRLQGLITGVPEVDALTAHELSERCRELSRQVFMAAITGLVERVARTMRANCEERFRIATRGDESDWIDDTPMPCLIEQGHYDTLQEYWKSLDVDEIRELMEHFIDIFGSRKTREDLQDYADRTGEEYQDDDVVRCFASLRWAELSAEDRVRIYRYHSKLPL